MPDLSEILKLRSVSPGGKTNTPRESDKGHFGLFHHLNGCCERVSKPGILNCVGYRKTLPSGDLLVNDLGIERKLVPDLFLTLNEGRLFQQLRKLKKTYRRHLLLIEGGSHSSKLWNERLLGLMTRLMAGWQIPIIWSNILVELENVRFVAH